MSHPYNSIRNDKVQKSRVSQIAGHTGSGGVTPISASEKVKRLTSSSVGAPEGGKASRRADRIHRKDGGRVKNPSVNVIINTAPKEEKLALPPMPPPGAMPPPPMPPGPPPGAMAGGPPPGGMPELPPELMPRKAGGRVSTMKGANMKAGAGWSEGLKSGTKVQPSPGKNDLGKDINRPRVVTFYAGGKVEAPQGVSPATKLPGGAGGGLGRLKKFRDEKKRDGKTIKVPKGME